MGGMSEANDSKVNLDVPEHLEYSDEHVWVDSSVEPAMVGVTEYATEQFGELVYIDLPEVGTQVFSCPSAGGVILFAINN